MLKIFPRNQTECANQSIIHFKIRKRLTEQFHTTHHVSLCHCLLPLLDPSFKILCVRYIYKLKKFYHISVSMRNLQQLNIEMTTKYLLLYFLKELVNNHLSMYLYEKLLWRSQIHIVNIGVEINLLSYSTPLYYSKEGLLLPQ